MRTRARFDLLVAVALLAACSDDAGPGPPPDAGGDGGPITPDAGPPDTGCSRDEDCDDGRFCNGQETCVAGECLAGEPPLCDDGEACTIDECSEEARACTWRGMDADRDGHADAACAGDDCDDADPLRHTGATEHCDAAHRDEDCNPATYGFQDLDADGFAAGTCCNGGTCGDDCNDMTAQIHPGLPEVCDGRDNDCDGGIDEGVVPTFWRDSDGDGYAPDGLEVESITACFAPAGFVSLRADCDDSAMGIHPGAYDSCDGARVDENCNGTPNDPPAGCTCTDGATRMCPAMGACAAGRETCTGGTWSACSVAPVLEACNGADDDCDGMVDDGVGRNCWRDVDRDGWAAGGAPETTHCICPGGTTDREPLAPYVDCDDVNPARSPSQVEICDGVDQDCDGTPDDGLPVVIAYRDLDGDGYFGTPVMACSGLPFTSPTNSDCNDASANTHPGQLAYFEAPHCPASAPPCMDFTGWSCGTREPVTGTCRPTATPSWDHNCDGVETPIPPTTDRCTMLSCSGTCSGSGFAYSSPSSPGSCGGFSPYAWSCGGCGGFGGSSCERRTASLRLPCR